MRVLLTGGSGFVGSHLKPRLERDGHEVLLLGRGAGADFDWSPESVRRGVEATEAVVHLAGEGIADRRWTEARKRALLDSRLETTALLARAVAGRKSRCFLTASAVGYYGPSETPGLTESSPPGNDFLARLCVAWEAAARPAADAGVRVVHTRFGVVLHPDGGALKKMLLPFRMFVGGPIGSGRQWLSWIHMSDLTSLVAFLLSNDGAAGPYNATAPGPVRMRELARSLGAELHRPSVVPVPAIALRLLLGEGADFLLTGQHVLPERASAASFRFSHATIDEALHALLSDGT